MEANRDDRQPSRQGDEQPGLCDTCVCAKVCMIYAQSQRPIHECTAYTAVQTSSERAHGVVQGKELAGLCVNCSRRHTCTFERPEGGVWHCEEYY